jgi:hypothetical protein
MPYPRTARFPLIAALLALATPASASDFEQLGLAIFVFVVHYFLCVAAIQLVVSTYIAARRWRDRRDLQSILYAAIPLETLVISVGLFLLLREFVGILYVMVVAPWVLWLFLHGVVHRVREPRFVYRRMVQTCRICPSCGDAGDVRAYDSAGCGASLSGTIPGPLPEGVQLAATHPSTAEQFALWAAEVESGIAGDQLCCHRCSDNGELLHFPFALANVEPHISRWLPTATSVSVSLLLLPLGMGVFGWKPRRGGLAYPMKLVLCGECLAELEDFYGRPARDAYRLHPWYDRLDEHGFSTFVSEAEFKKWEHLPSKRQ